MRIKLIPRRYRSAYLMTDGVITHLILQNDELFVCQLGIEYKVHTDGKLLKINRANRSLTLYLDQTIHEV